jgi:glycosyltransferase involved in cell wall biosynthesis
LMKICLVGHTASALRGAGSGGAEKQIALLARHLARRGNDVTFVVTGDSGGDGVVEGVRILSGWQANRGVRKIRFLTYRLPNLKQVLKDVAADAYYIMGISYYTLPVAAIARGRGGLSLFGMANDRDFEASSGRAYFAVGGPILSSIVGPLAHYYFRQRVLPYIDWIIVQNEDQASRCQKLCLPSRTIPAMVDPPPDELLGLPEEVDLVWIGNVLNDTRRSKGVPELTSLVKLLPRVRFEIIGELSAHRIQPLIKDLRERYNVRLTGSLSYFETLKRIARSRLVINTSPVEGFSNVMLEAWALGKPVISLSVNPNSLLHSDGLGYCAEGDLRAMAQGIQELLVMETDRHLIGERCQSYVGAMHAPDQICAQFEEIIGEFKEKSY